MTFKCWLNVSSLLLVLVAIVHHSTTHFSAVEQMCTFAHFGGDRAPGNTSELKDSGLTPPDTLCTSLLPSITHTHMNTRWHGDAVYFHVSDTLMWICVQLYSSVVHRGVHMNGKSILSVCLTEQRLESLASLVTGCHGTPVALTASKLWAGKLLYFFQRICTFDKFVFPQTWTQLGWQKW